MPPSELLNEIQKMNGLPTDIIYMYAANFKFPRSTLTVIKEYLEGNIYFPGNSLSGSECMKINSKMDTMDTLEQEHNPNSEKVIEIPREYGKHRHKCTIHLTDEAEMMYQEILGGFTPHEISRVLSELISQKFRELKPYSDMENLKFVYPMLDREIIEKKHINSKSNLV